MAKKWRVPYFIQDVVPPILGLVFGVFYFASVVRGIVPYIKGYLVVVVILLIATRFPKVYYYKKHLIPPISEYKRAKAQGRMLSAKKLADLYLHLASFVERAQILTAIMWVGAMAVAVLLDHFFLIGTTLSAVALVFTGLITMGVSMSLSYFISKAAVAPMLEEVQLQLEVVPDVKRYRVSLRYKIILSILGLNLIAFLALGVLIFAKFSFAMERDAIQDAPRQLAAEAEKIREAPPENLKEVLARFDPRTYHLAVYSPDGSRIAATDGDFFDRKTRKIDLEMKSRQVLDTTRGYFYVWPVDPSRVLVVAANKDSMSTAKVVFLLKILFFYILTMMLLFACFIWFLGRDVHSAVGKLSVLSKKISSGDLRETIPVWSDDELGDVGDHLRETFSGLKRMGKELDHAAAIVDQEVNRTVHITHTLSDEAKHQLEIAAKTGRSTEVLEGAVGKVSASMDQVVNTTQDVSSIILEMQASVEEIASNSEILMKSVEKTVASANEMSTTAEQINSSTVILRESSQESVSFLTELDAALQETMRNATVLQDTSVKVTQDAESGFSSVAAVEEEIIRSRKASAQSLESLQRLQQSMDRIAKIVDVIEEVTEQTNLLALNASIIAAGAGEYGKSFAVVATQIRELSSRTAGHAKEIRNVIKALVGGGEEMTQAINRTQQVVDSSVQLSRKAGEALKTILESASTQEELSKRISIAMEEIAHGGLTATDSVNRIFQMIEGITRATDEQAKTTRYLHQEAEKVREVAMQLRNATQEQAKGARVISESMIRITSDSQASAGSVKEQADETSLLFSNTQELLSSSRRIESAFRELSTLTGALQQSASLLNEEMKKYRF